MLETKRNSLLILQHARNLGRQGALKLIESFGSIEQVIESGYKSTTRMLFNKWRVGTWEEDLEAMHREGVQLLCYFDECYPKHLLQISDFPLALYVKGNFLQTRNLQLTIVGTRNATLYGKQAAEKISQDLASNSVSIVSGLARGIDTAAHQGALLAKGRTFAIIGSGLSHIYPKENCILAQKIAENGAVMSEYPMHMPPAKGLFPRRNRLLSAVADGICLIESAISGGAITTMNYGIRHKKLLFALPGRIDWPSFEGNHLFLKQKKAHLVENASDILSHFALEQSATIKKRCTLLTDEESQFLALLPKQEKSIDELVLLTQLPIIQLNILLTRLVLKKVVKEFPGKLYKKII